MCVHEVLGVPEDDEGFSFTFEQACAVAEAERAPLTLAKATDPGWLMRWFAPATAGHITGQAIGVGP